MVMEPPPSTSPPQSIPSPQSVGREFVRQYYTLLNQSPLHLHRFYSHNSSFIHGGLDVGDKVSEPVTGQQEIHQKIMQLNFRDCHAKIRQVDAHATLESGVVVQVSGELSNNGQPMRRFMQTFVLAPQSPKKYYVHNDIFRYQDEVFSDEDQEGADSGTTSILDESNESVNTPVINSHNAATTNKPETKEPVSVSVNSNNNANNEEVHLNGGSPKAALPDVAPKQDDAVRLNEHHRQHRNNNNSHHDDEEDDDEEEVDDEVEEEEEEEEETAPASSSNEEQQQQSAESQGTSAAAKSSNGPPPSAVANGPLTYAKLVKSGQGSGSNSATTSAASAATSGTGNPSTTSGGSGSGTGGGGGGSGGGAAPPMTGPGFATQGGLPSAGFGKVKSQSSPSAENKDVPTPNNKGMGSYRGRGGMSGGRGGNNMRERYGSTNRDGDDDRPRGNPRQSLGGQQDRGSSMSSGPYSDSQQVFVGNLPHDCTESDLESLFGNYGKVVEIRINSKGANVSKNLPTGSRVPNYGFVVFEDERSVQECLKKKPIFLPDINHRLNIEEKKNNKARVEEMRGSSAPTGNRQGMGPAFDRGSQDNLGNRGGMSDRGGRGGPRGGSRGGGGRGMYSGQQGRGGGQQMGQRGGYNRRN